MTSDLKRIRTYIPAVSEFNDYILKKRSKQLQDKVEQNN